MQIPQELKQFSKKKALVLTASQHESKFYKAFNGEIELIKELKIEKPDFSDKEVSSIPSSEKDMKTLAQQDFSKAFKEILCELEKENFEEVYLFCSKHIVNEVEKLLPQYLEKKLQKVVKGNFNKHHPTELVEELNKLK